MGLLKDEGVCLGDYHGTKGCACGIIEGVCLWDYYWMMGRAREIIVDDGVHRRGANNF